MIVGFVPLTLSKSSMQGLGTASTGVRSCYLPLLVSGSECGTVTLKVESHPHLHLVKANGVVVMVGAYMLERG